MGHLPNNCIELLCRTQLVSEASFPFAGHKMPINMRASLTKGELRDVMESIGEVEKCLGKILELKEAYKKLDNYWSDNNEIHREARLAKGKPRE